MATKLTLKVGEGDGPLIVVHRHDRPWELHLKGLGEGKAFLLGREYSAEGEHPLATVPAFVQLRAENVGRDFCAELVMR